MTKHIGDIYLPNANLHYYLFGNSKDGYCVEITACKCERACGFVSSDLLSAQRCAYKLYRAAAFPSNLNDYLEDFKFDNDFY